MVTSFVVLPVFLNYWHCYQKTKQVMSLFGYNLKLQIDTKQPLLFIQNISTILIG